MDEADGEVVTLSEIEHYAYCARQWALIHLDRLWADNEPTAVGHIIHSRVDQMETRIESRGKVARSLTVWSDTHRLFGRADTVEFRDGEAPVPVEHKSGRRGMLPARLQLGAQAICLEEMFGQPVLRGVLWLHGRRRRSEVPITDDLKRQVLEVAQLIRATRSQPGLPPSVFDGRCPDCSLIDECLPGLVIDHRRERALHRGLFDPGSRHSASDA